MRAFLGVAIAAVALGGALGMHNYISDQKPCQLSRETCKQLEQVTGVGGASTSERPGWVDPVAIVIAVAGVGFGLILIAQARGGSAVKRQV